MDHDASFRRGPVLPATAMLRRSDLLLPFVLLWAAPSAVADPRDHGEEHQHEQDRMLEALRSGEVVPLSTVLEAVNRDFDGSLLDVEPEREHGRWVYEIKLLTAQGTIIKLYYDARTSILIGARGQGVDAARRR